MLSAHRKGRDANEERATRARGRRRAGFPAPRRPSEWSRVLGAIPRDIGAVSPPAARVARGNSRRGRGGPSRPLRRRRRARRRRRVRAGPPPEPRPGARRHARHLPRPRFHHRHGVPVRPAHDPPDERLPRGRRARMRDAAVWAPRRRIHRRRDHHHDHQGVAGREGGCRGGMVAGAAGVPPRSAPGRTISSASRFGSPGDATSATGTRSATRSRASSGTWTTPRGRETRGDARGHPNALPPRGNARGFVFLRGRAGRRRRGRRRARGGTRRTRIRYSLRVRIKESSSIPDDITK